MKKLVSLFVLGLCLALSQDSGVAARCHNSTAKKSARTLDNCQSVSLSQELTNNGKTYYGDVRIGGQSVQLRFDTMARDSWVPEGSYECREGCKRIKGSTITVGYGKTLDGTVYQDDVQVSGIKVDRHRFLAARVGGDEKGAIGLASQDINDLKGSTFLQALKKQSIPRIFALRLSSNGGELVIGCSNEGSGMRYHALVDGGSNGWIVRLWRVQLNGKDLLDWSQELLLDTGSDRIRVPTGPFKRICKTLKAQQEGDSWIVDCKYLSVRMDFKIDNHVYRSDGKTFLTERQGKCELNIEPWSNHQWSLGTSFLRSFNTIFDLDKRRVGLGKSNNN